MPSVTQREPQQEAKKTLTIRIPPGLHAYIKAQAQRAKLSMNEYVKLILARGG